MKSPRLRVRSLMVAVALIAARGPLQDKAQEVASELQGPVQDAAQQVKDVATQAATDTADQAKSAAEDVKAPLQG